MMIFRNCQSMQEDKANYPRRQVGLNQRMIDHIAGQQRDLEVIANCFQQQPKMLTLQCKVCVQELASLRVSTSTVAAFLDSQHAQQLRPYGCLALLRVLDYRVTQLMFCISLLTPICQDTSRERVILHLYIRSLFSLVVETLDGCLALLTALNDPERYCRQVSVIQEGRTL